MMKKGYIVFLLSGCTNGGKTSASDRIQKEYPNSILIKQDDYYYPANDPNHLWLEYEVNEELTNGSKVIRHQDWERMESIDWAKLDETLASLHEELNEQIKENHNEINNNIIEDKDFELIKSKIKLIIIEGHCLLCHTFPKFLEIKKKIFFHLSQEVCRARRLTRAYIPPDPIGYFDECVWPSYLEHFAIAKKNHSDALFLNGELDKETIFQQIKKLIDDVYLNLI